MTDSIDNHGRHDILTPEEVAQYLRKSLSWVYKHWQVLGGRKLGGSLFFPGKENLYEYLFGQEQRVEVRFHPPGKTMSEKDSLNMPSLLLYGMLCRLI